ncbi:MAG: MFS transporter [Gammaproteobacteria bacterium]|nr:MFS transporter [Gammaproteobacteria bacterium]
MSATPELPYWRLSGFYLVYFAGLGALMPYWGLYLSSLGFSAVEIGELIAVIMATKIVAPNIWGWLADRSGRHMQLIRITSLFSALCFAGVYVDSSYGWMLFVMLVFSFFWNANLPQFEANTLAYLGQDTHRYSGIRLWGSIGFILSVVVLGSVTEQYGSEWVPSTVLVLLISVWALSLFTPQAASPEHHDGAGFLSVIRQPTVIALFVVCFLLQASHGPYYAFYTLYMEVHHYSRSTIGLYWAVGVVAEIIVFMLMHRLMPRFGARNLLMWALLLSALRWLLIGVYVESHAIMLFAQTLHAASFGIYHAVAIHLVHGFFPGRLMGRGQALYSSISFGAGGAVGSLVGGYLWDGAGAMWTYTFSSILCLIAAVITARMIHQR